MRRRLIAPLGLLVLLLTVQAVYAGDFEDAKAAKANAFAYKNGAEQWSGLLAQHEYDATTEYYAAWARYNDCLDEQLIEPGSEEDQAFRAVMAAGGDVEAEDHGGAASDWCKAVIHRVTGDVHKASATGDYNQGNTKFLAQDYAGSIPHYNDAAAPMPAMKYQSAADQFAQGIDDADAAKAKWHAAWEYLGTLME